MEVIVNALMLRAVDYKDNDKILTLLTDGYGKIAAGIRGVKKAGAKLKFASQPFCFAEYVLSKNGQKYTVINACESESFYDLRTDINKFYAACALSESVCAMTAEGEECNEIFTESVKALSNMCNGDEGFELVKFLCFLLKNAGYGISADKCPHCGESLIGKSQLRFDTDIGSFTCFDCGKGSGASRSTYNVVRKVYNLSYEKEYVSSDGIKRALRMLREYLRIKLGIGLNSLNEYIKL